VPAFRMISDATSREVAHRTLPSASRGSTFPTASCSLTPSHLHKRLPIFPTFIHCVT
jgi:hypothetical protein